MATIAAAAVPGRPVRPARLVLERLSLRPPVDVLAAIRAAGITVHEVAIPANADGHIAYHRTEDTFGIFVNTRFRDPLRRRFTLAHEFGHYVLHRALIRQAGDTDFLADPRLEAEASEFAGELLMPESEVRLFRCFPDPERHFRVSRAAWEYRCRRLSWQQ